MAGKSVYQIVTDKIIEKLQEGTVPWRKPWVNNSAVNWLTQKPYRGINTMLLDPGEYATKKQILAAGGEIKQDEYKKSSIVVFWLWGDKKKKGDDDDEETGKKRSAPVLRFYQVWEINTQVIGLRSKRNTEEYEHDPVEEAERLIEGYEGKPSISHRPGRATYAPALDHVNVPPMKDFPNIDEYYSTFFHELIHSTGHHSRLNRKEIENIQPFGSEDYSREELVAEIGAAMMCSIARIDNSTFENSAAYISGWLRKLKDDARLVVTAAAQAQKAVDHITGHSHENKEEDVA